MAFVILAVAVFVVAAPIAYAATLVYIVKEKRRYRQ